MYEHDEEQHLNPQDGLAPRDLAAVEALSSYWAGKEALKLGNDGWIIVCARGLNEHGNKVHYYLAIPTDRVEAFMTMKGTGELFDPEDWGIVIEYGLGDPTPKLVKLMAEHFGMPAPDSRVNEDIDNDGNFRGNRSGLTDRHLEVMGLVAKGMTNIEIGKVLNLSDRTIQKHVGTVCNKLDLPNRAALAAFFTARHRENSLFQEIAQPEAS